MRAHRGQYEVKIMSRVLEVSASGYYAWCQRPTSQREQMNHELVQYIHSIHAHSRGSYGVRRVQASLRQRGVSCNHKRVERLMRTNGLRGKGRGRRRPRTTSSDPARAAAPNLLQRDFSAQQPNQKWLADITYLDTDEGYAYLACVLDTFSRRIVGWAIADHLRTELVEEAVKMALHQRTPLPGLLHHSDQGIQYSSDDYLTLLRKHRLTISMSRLGNCYDNAMMESFFGTLKAECATAPFPTRAAARLAIFEYLEVWYNRRRLHSALNYASPAQFEQYPILSWP